MSTPFPKKFEKNSTLLKISPGACIELTKAQSNPVLSFGRFHESGGFPKGWPFGRARRRETPQRPDLIKKIGLKEQTKDSRQEF